MILERKTYINDATDEVRDVFLVDGEEVEEEDYLDLLDEDEIDEEEEIIEEILDDYSEQISEITGGCPYCIREKLEEMLGEVYELGYDAAIEDMDIEVNEE